jgi:hypothetical protein
VGRGQRSVEIICQPQKIDEVIEAGTGGWQEDAGVTFLIGYSKAMKLRII